MIPYAYEIRWLSILLQLLAWEAHNPFVFVINAGQAIVAAVTSGNKRFFLGTDSAPHDRLKKESACGCAGVFNAPVALSVYAKVFEEVYLDCLFLFHMPTHLSFFVSL